MSGKNSIIMCVKELNSILNPIWKTPKGYRIFIELIRTSPIKMCVKKAIE